MRDFLIQRPADTWIITDVVTRDQFRVPSIRCGVPTVTIDHPTCGAVLLATGYLLRTGSGYAITSTEPKAKRFARKVTSASQRPAERKARPVRRDAPCVHLGERVSTLGCQSCQGFVELPIFACAIHGECVKGSPQEDLPGCRTCKDYSPSHKSAAQDSPRARNESPVDARAVGIEE